MAQVATERSGVIASAVADPAPLGLSAFALTTFVLTSTDAGFFPVAAGGVAVAVALFYGGIAQLCAGMWEFKRNNTFGATAFTSYGAFWLSYAAILVPGTGILAAITPAIHQALGVYLLGWTIFTGLMFLGTLRSNIALVAVFGLLFLAFLLLTIGELGPSTTAHQIGGYVGVLTAIVAWYTALAGILASVKSPFQLPVFPLS
jgi:succinate-acetate transporter protein